MSYHKTFALTITSIHREKWILLYQFIDSFYKGRIDRTVFNKLSSRDKELRFQEVTDDSSEKVEFAPINENSQVQPKHDTVLWLVYNKKDKEENLSEIAYFILLERQFKTLHLAIQTDDYEVRSKYDIFFSLIYDTSSEESAIFQIKDIKYQNDIITKREPLHPNKTLKSDTSRVIFPIASLDKSSFEYYFGYPSNTSSSKEFLKICEYLQESIDKLQNINTSQLSFRSRFEEWFIKAYCYSLGSELKELDKNQQQKTLLVNTLKMYYDNIYELVANFIFHTDEQKGFLYVIFNKKSNFSKTRKSLIPDFDNYDDKQRFVEIGILDWHHIGIVETYSKENENTIDRNKNNIFSFYDFFSLEPSDTTNLSHLHLRYLSHLGIKTFVKTIISHDGYFRVESNKQHSDHTKQVISTSQENGIQTIIEDNDTTFVPGTHYDIIIPITYKERNPHISTIILQGTSFKEKIINALKANIPDIKCIPFPFENNNSNITSKQLQTDYIKTIGDKIVRLSGNHSDLAIDIQNRDIDEKILFKILAYSQLSSEDSIKTIILVNIKDSTIDNICELINQLLIEPGYDKIWSNDHALILMSSGLRKQIICGDKAYELYFLNRQYQINYPQSVNYFEKGWHDLNQTEQENAENESQSLQQFLFPYELIIGINHNTSPFGSYIATLLNKTIEPANINGTDGGYRLNINTNIGNKLIINHFYEADSLFQITFYAERFAFQITRNILKILNAVNKRKKPVIVGYKHYSELLVQSICYSLSKIYNSTIPSCLALTTENDQLFITFGNKTEQDAVTAHPENYCFAVIVPIGTTLSTNDKVNAFLKRELGDGIDIIYNHCILVVRDGGSWSKDVTYLEKSQKWVEIDHLNQTIRTKYKNAETINYSLFIGDERMWHSIINSDISFPKEWWKEVYVNNTENSSINSKNLMGLPYIHEPKRYDESLNLRRLIEFKDNIKYGHIKAFDTHFQYYFDTKGYINRCHLRKRSEAQSPESEFDKWIESIREEFTVSDEIQIIVTPNTELQSHFVSIINEQLFDNRALVIFLDINNWRNNIIYKLSFLKHYKNVHYIYVDHALRTGELFHKTESYLKSRIKLSNINEPLFHSAIVLINNLSYDTFHKVTNGIVAQRLFSFIHLFSPPTWELDNKCILCTQKEDLEKLREHTVLESCKKTISEKINKLAIKEESANNEIISLGEFCRFYITHLVFRTLSTTFKNQGYTKELIADKLNTLFNNQIPLPDYFGVTRDSTASLFTLLKSQSSILHNAFVKEMKSMLQSDYIYIRDYADRLLLTLLNFVYEAKSYDCQSIILVSSIMDCLSLRMHDSSYKDNIIKNVKEYCKSAKEHADTDTANQNTFFSGESTNKESNDIKNRISKLEENIGAFEKNTLKVAVLEESSSGNHNIVHNDVYRKFSTFIQSSDLSLSIYQNKIQYILALTSLPLSRYIHIRNYTHSFLLNELHTIFEEKKYDEYTFHYMRVILGCLSLLKSNALIRKEVITLSWSYCYETYKKILSDNTATDNLRREIVESINSFQKEFHFQIKNTIHDDRTKSFFLSELLRTGSEINEDSFNNENDYHISDTKIGNELFSKFDEERCKYFPFSSSNKNNNDSLRKYYIQFLVCIFYENTSIQRNTLYDFRREIRKIQENPSLIGQNVFKWENNTAIKKYLRKISSEEYYYKFFKPYINNNITDIDFIERLISVAKAQETLDNIKENHSPQNILIETDIQELLSTLSDIMDADDVFLSFIDERNTYPKDNAGTRSDGKISEQICYFIRSEKQEYSEKSRLNDPVLPKSFYTYEILAPLQTYQYPYPLIIKDNLNRGDYGESFYVTVKNNQSVNCPKYDRCCILLLYSLENGEKVLFCTVTFLYEKSTNENCSYNSFKARCQEHGRLLLLIKDDIEEYLIEHLKGNKVWKQWSQKCLNQLKYDKIYGKSNHVFTKLMNEEMASFDNLCDEMLFHMAPAWYEFTNQIISFLYASIIIQQDNYTYKLNVTEDTVIDNNCTLGDIFNSKFRVILNSLSEKRWNGNIIEWNNDNFDKTAVVGINKQIVQTFIVQCIDNSLNTNKHCPNNCMKQINITISDKSIDIFENIDTELIGTRKDIRIFLEGKKVSFLKIKQDIENLNCIVYSSTTLTSLQALVECLNKAGKTCKKYRCSYGYDAENLLFNVKLSFYNKTHNS